MNRTYNTKTKWVEGVKICIYCGKIVYGYRDNGFESETFYNCSCEGAKAELLMEKEIKKVKFKYRKRLRYNKRAIDNTIKEIRAKKQRLNKREPDDRFKL